MKTRTKTAARRYACGTCGKRGKADEMIYSRHTGSRYCADLTACMKRRKRGRRHA